MSSDKIYLIRSSGYILGPYSKKEVEKMIQNGSVSFNDEAIKPESIGRAIQDHPDFSDYVNKMDMQTRVTNFIMNLSGDFTKKTRKLSEDESVTKTVTNTLNMEGNLSGAEDASFELVGKKNTNKHSKFKPKSESDRIAHEKVSRYVKRTWQFIIASTIAIAGFILFQLFAVPYYQNMQLSEQIKTEGLFLYNSGDYKNSLTLYNKGYENNLLTTNDKKRILWLFLANDNIAKAEDVLKEIKPTLSSDENLLLEGIMDLYDKSYSSAKNNLSSIKNKKQEAWFSLALLDWITKDYKSSELKVDQLVAVGYNRGAVFYLKILNLINVRSDTEGTFATIIYALNNSREFHQEILLLRAYLQSLTKDSDMENTVKELLNKDPYFYKQAKYDAFMPVSMLFDWSYLLPYCEKIFNTDPDNAYLNALYGFCFLKNQRYRQASQYIEKSKNQKPQDELILSIYAYNLMLEGDFSKAETVLGSIEKPTAKLPFILKAKVFEQDEQWKFALNQWDQLLRSSPYHISAIAGLATNNYRLEKRRNMVTYRDMGLNRYPYHIDLLKLSEK